MDICAIKCINEKKVKETVKTIPKQKDIGQMADIFKALSDPSRLKIVLALLNQEHCVCDIAVICNQTDSAISHQLRILRTLKIVKNRREGKIIYYSIDDEHVTSLINMSLDHVRH
ncbi:MULTISPECIES: ArsR/SmtB family transcription factor [Desulfobacula]|uniref:Transcriptional regulator, ArsR family n=2 Tax=Desulfobacula TaxID=28222 RepID=K0NHB1_DESTT|nr:MULTISPECIES: metalloregulator ArsR/SmtB family transcription factor [Desulfobacula]CCK78392.1 transcriptional regulator, ArsR family [Desulfobacula toluolica Tol2]SDU54002.1 transcriptional regulator, ArsR family [Desulfobacula phenolica]